MRVIAGAARGVRLASPGKGEATRPTVDRVKEAMFSAVQLWIPGAAVLDLFAGSGQLGIEALSRGARFCVFVDNESTSCELIRRNLNQTQLYDGSKVMHQEVQAFIASCTEQFDLIVLDPPYRCGWVERLLAEIDRITAPGGIVIAETEHGVKLPQQCGGLQLKKQYRYGAVALTRYEKKGANGYDD